MKKSQINKICKKISNDAKEAQASRTEITESETYKRCLSWTKEELAFCKVKYQQLAGQLTVQLLKAEKEIEKLKGQITPQ